MQAIHYFPGGNTAEGFCSHFEDILPAPARRRMFYLKGGPGVGKSTLMRRVGEAAEKAGLEVEYFHCSSDPDSLDAVCLPQKGTALMDGTAPHVYDPVAPGARDTLVSLGDFLDEAALRPCVDEILRLQAAISGRFRRCYCYLGGARNVLEAARPGREDPRRAHELAAEWADTLPLRGGKGSIRRLFGSAYTPKGHVDLAARMELKRRVTVDCPFGLDAGMLMAEAARQAAARGLHAVALMDPLCPKRISHVILPAHGVGLLSGRRGPADRGEWLDADGLFELEEGAEKEQSFDRNAYELLIQRAIEQLSAAKKLHDELESHYVGHMDFLKWQTMLDRILRELELA